MTFFEALSILLSAAAFTISLAVFYFSDKRSVTANAIATDANKKAIEANRIALEANSLSKDSNTLSLKANATAENALQLNQHDYNAKYIPKFEADIEVFSAQIDEPQDLIILTIKNKIYRRSIIKSISIQGQFAIRYQDNLPAMALYNNPIQFLLVLKYNEVRSGWIQKVRKQDVTNPFEEDHFIDLMYKYLHKCSIMIKYVTEDHKGYETHLNYDPNTKTFVGEPIELP